jgi:threonine-phosphate decarboxylase
MRKNAEEFQHGGDIYTDGILIGKELLDFSSNINPLGVPTSFTDHIEEAVNALNRYPDIEYRQLKKEICSYIDKKYINEENILLGNGAAEIIDLAIGCFKSILLLVPSFGEYEKSALKAGCSINYSYLKNNMAIDYEDILQKLESLDIQALVIANPNNPNGGIIDKGSFMTVINLCKEKGITIIIDEAFIEFTVDKGNSFIDEIESYQNIFIIRALTKFFALPGIRFGFGISKDKSLVSEIREKQNPWNINCFAETAAKFVLKDELYINKSLEWISSELPFLTERLSGIELIEKVYESSSNFILCKLKEITAQGLYEYCISKGVVIRRASNFKGLDGSFVRFAVKDRESNQRLIQVLSGYSKQK